MSTHRHPLDEAATFVEGGRSGLAERLGVTPSAIGNWKKRGVPVEHCWAIERLTDGRVTRKQLCPVWERIWPDLKTEHGIPLHQPAGSTCVQEVQGATTDRTGARA